MKQNSLAGKSLGTPEQPTRLKTSKQPAADRSSVEIDTGQKRVKPVTTEPISIELEDEKKPQEAIEFDEDSAIFAFDDEPKPAEAGALVLDFLNNVARKEASASGSALDDFLSELE